MNLDQARQFATEHADTCLDPGCWRLKHALDSAANAEALRQLNELIDTMDRDTSDLPLWSEVSRPWPTIAFPDPTEN
jgi:hypothetical protein